MRRNRHVPGRDTVRVSFRGAPTGRCPRRTDPPAGRVPRVRVAARRTPLAAVMAAILLGGCAVVPLPATETLLEQGPREHAWDASKCQAEAADRARYIPTFSPLGNLFAKMFFWGVAGASLGGLITGFPAAIVTGTSISASSEISGGVIAGAGAGGIVGTVESWSGQERFERAWVACMEAHGYALTHEVAAAGAPSSPAPMP
jgi:hypothetical protein